jgi:hypothetical protein
METFSFFEKPILGQGVLSTRTKSQPVQLFLPEGGVAVGLVSTEVDLDEMERSQQPINTGTAIVFSNPEDAELDRLKRRAISVALYGTTFTNFIITTLLYASAAAVEAAQVEIGEGRQPSNLQRVSSTRTPPEIASYSFLVIAFLMCSVSTLLESPMGLTMASIILATNFSLGVTSVPYFTFSFRYVLDAVCIYFALLLRSKLVQTYQLVHTHRH